MAKRYSKKDRERLSVSSSSKRAYLLDRNYLNSFKRDKINSRANARTVFNDSFNVFTVILLFCLVMFFIRKTFAISQGVDIEFSFIGFLKFLQTCPVISLNSVVSWLPIGSVTVPVLGEIIDILLGAISVIVFICTCILNAISLIIWFLSYLVAF